MNQLPEGWKLLQSDYLHREPWLTVRRDQLLLPNGHTIPKYFVLEYPDWVNVIAITQEGKFLLIRQYRHAMGLTSYEICAGVRDQGDETHLEAAKRELMEETGYGGGNWQEWLVTAPNPATSNNWVHCFLATDVEPLGASAPEPSEQITTHLVDYQELKAMMADGRIIQSTHLVGLWKYLAEHPVRE